MDLLARGNSMLPTLKDGELYKVDLNVSEIIIGDIIAYYINDTVICHRVIDLFYTKSKKLFIKTKGDNCTVADPHAITMEMVIGKIIL